MYRIFIVEDDEIIAKTVKRHLESWDYETALALDFSNVLGNLDVLQSWYEAYESGAYSQGYMENAVLAVRATGWELNLRLEELQGGRYLVTHEITIW